MNQKLRQSGIDFIGDVPWGTHFCQFYQTKEDLTDILVPYFKAGLENNEFCMWVTSSPLNAEEVKEALRRTIPDFDVYLEQGQIEIIPYTYWYVKEGVFNSERLLNGWVEKLNQALESGYEGLRLAGNTSGLEKEDRGYFVEYEKKVDAVISSCHMIALCTYPLDVHDVTEAIGIVANHQFTLVKKKGKWERIESSGRKNIIERQRAEEALRQSEQHFRLKLESILSPDREMANLELATIIDAEAVQSLMNDFYRLAHIPMALLDLKGNILVSVGWQEICTRFHRIHPETCKYCVESDINLTADVAPGGYKLYKCKNNMWDVVTPIMVEGQHIGNIFSGQFLFDNEPLDYDLFRSQARKYGFNEEEYIKALEKVPRLSREAVDTSMAFFMTFANMISKLSYSNIKLSQSLAERDTVVDALRESEKRERARSDELAVVLDAVPVSVYTAHDPQALQITGNRLSYEWLRIPAGTNFSKSTPERGRPEMFKLFKDGVEMQPADMPSQMAAAGIEVNNFELDIVSADGEIRHVLGNARPLRDEKGNPRGSISAFIDITERKKAEEALKKAHENLEEKVKERTIQLEKAYKSLKESEKGLAEAQKMAHVGSWNRDLLTGEVYWSDEMYHIYGHNPQESGATYDELLNQIHPEDRDYVNNAIIEGLKEKPHGIDYRIILPDGEERTVHSKPEIIYDEKNIPIRIKGIVQDITERKKAEEKIRILADVVESSSDGIITESLEGIITSWNKGAEQIYGYSAEEILGRNVSILEPDNLKGEINQFIGKIKQGEKIKNYETLRLKKDGATINVALTISPVFDSYGKLTAISAITRDITESKQREEALQESEARLRRFYESNLLGVFYYNLDGSIIDANDKLLEIVGYTREDLQAGQVNWCKITPQEYRQLDEHAAAELKATGMNTPYEKEYIRKDGSRVPVIVGVATFDQARNEGIAFVLDITERKEAEKSLATIEIARKKEIHHRIKNNLQIISSLLDLQAEKFGNRKFIMNSEVMEAFRESQDRVISMALIHEELHKGEGLDTLNFSPYIEELAENLFHTYRLGNANISLNLNLEENIFFDMDIAVPLGIIINELVSNSLKHAFSGRDKGEIRIKLRREEKGECKNEGCRNTSFILTVSDDGIGLPESLDSENPYTLGLQLLTSLVDQLDGELEVKRNNGTEFTIKFTVTEKNNQASNPAI